MLENIQNCINLSMISFKNPKKKMYEERMEQFRNENSHYFEEMFAYVKDADRTPEDMADDTISDEAKAACAEIGEAVTSAIFDKFATVGFFSKLSGGEGKKKFHGDVKDSISLFMIYYIFPSILLAENKYSTPIADAIRDSWREMTKNPLFSYGTYAELHDSFKEKILGLF